MMVTRIVHNHLHAEKQAKQLSLIIRNDQRAQAHNDSLATLAFQFKIAAAPWIMSI